MIPRSLADQIGDLYSRIGDIERRNRNRKRTGTIAEVDHDKGRYRVKLADSGGKPYLTGWLPTKQLGAGGVKVDVLLSEGEQVDVVSESGDLTDATVEMSSYSEANQRPGGGKPFTIVVGGASLTIENGAVTITAGTIKLEGAVEITGASVTHNGKNIGDTHKHGGIVPGGSLTDVPS